MFISLLANTDSPLAQLGVDTKSYLFQLITFVLAFFVLKHFAFGPISRTLAHRRKVILDGIELGKQMEAEKAKLDELTAETLLKARQEADDIIAAAHKEAHEKIAAAEKTAHQKAHHIEDSAKERISQREHQALLDLKNDIANLITETSETVIGQKLSSAKDQSSIRKTLEEAST